MLYIVSGLLDHMRNGWLPYFEVYPMFIDD
jgi:hypothetical protein